MLSSFVENEVQRQLELVKIIHEIRNSKALPVKKDFQDITAILKDTDAKMIKKGIESGSVVLAQRLPGFKGILGRQIQPNKRFGTELSNYAKLAGVKGIIHSDEDLGKYGMKEEPKLRKELGDCFVLVVAPKKQAEKALDYVLRRANMDYVPEETRKANPDGTSSFMRPLPGKARLYPETDVPPLPVTKELLESIKVSESLDEKKKRLEGMLNKELAGKILKSRNLHCFEKLVEGGADPMLAATTLENTIVSLRREGVVFKDLNKSLFDLFDEYSKGTFVKAAIPDILKGMAKGASAESVIKVYRLQKISGAALKNIIDEEGHDMQRIMAKYRLQVDPKELIQVLKKKK
jgi:glutamyl-tRNA(Gln) amidotransferase subunit E